MNKNPSNLFIQSILLLSLLVMPVYGRDDITEPYDDKKVANIEIVVDSENPSNSVDPTILKKQLKTQEGGAFSQANFDQDLKALSQQYDSSHCEVISKDGSLYITIHVVPKPVIQDIIFIGNERFSSSKLQDKLNIQAGSVYSKQEFTAAFNKLKAFYFERGYFECQIDYTVISIPDTDKVEIQIRIEENRPGKIKKIVIEGVSNSERSELLDQMYLKKYNFLYSWATGGGVYNDELRNQDYVTIHNYFQNKGYPDALIDIHFSEDPGSDKLILEIKIDRKEQYHIGTIDIEGNTLISTEDLKSHLPFKEGSVYSPSQIQQGYQSIKDSYGQKGYIDASVNYETTLPNEKDPIYNLTYSVDEGQKYKIGLIHIFGNNSTKSNVILRESLLVPGELFDSRKLKATQQRLEAVGYFKSVNVFAVRTEADEVEGENYRDVYIEVEETSTGNFSVFMGFSSSDSVSGGLDLTERNFDIANVGKALKGDFSALRGGGEYFHIRGTLGNKQNNVLVSWLNPYLNDTRWRLGTELSATMSELQSDNTKVMTYGGSLYTSYPISNYWTAGARQRIRQVIDKLELNLKDENQIDSNSLKRTKDLFERNGVVSAFSLNIGYDSVDNAFKPHKGLRSYFEPEIAGVGGRFHFGKLTATNTLYLPLWKKGTLKFRADLKFLLPYGKSNKANMPYSERFFLGGDATMRGYKPWNFGPSIELLDNNGNVVDTETPQGGLSSSYFSAEFNQEIFRMLDVFAFCDVGSLNTQVLTINHLRTTAGVGLRIDLGNRAPIMLGWGYVFNKQDRQKKKDQPFFYSMGGQF